MMKIIPSGTRVPVDRKVFDAVRNFYAAGLNYQAHIDWANSRGGSYKTPAAPDVGYRSAAALIPSGAEIVVPSDSPGRWNTRGSWSR